MPFGASAPLDHPNPVRRLFSRTRSPSVLGAPDKLFSHPFPSRIPRPFLPIPLRRHLHPHPPRRQPHPLLLIEAHAGIVPLQQRRVHALRPEVVEELLRLFLALAEGLRCGVLGGRGRHGRRLPLRCCRG